MQKYFDISKDTKKRKVSIFVDFIQIGGGPMGYVFNMIRGLEKVSADNLKIKFIGIDLTRFKKKKYPLEIIMKGIRFCYRRFIFIKRYYALRNSEICVFQGCQNYANELIAKKNSSICIYMPHSPSIMADEQKMIWQLNGNVFNEQKYKELYENEKLLFENADYIVFPSKNSADAYFFAWGNIINTKRIVYLKSGVIERESISNTELRNRFKNKKIIAFCGRYVTHKGFDVFCEVSDTFKNEENIVFVSFGTGPLKSFISEHNVVDMGYEQNIGAVLKNVDLVVIPNRIAYYDLFPIECASFGKPMILSDAGGNKDQAEVFSDCLTFPSGDVSAFHNQIMEALQKLSENSLWGEANRTVYKNQFTEISLMERWLDFFNTISAEKNALEL